MVCAPFLLIGFSLESQMQALKIAWFNGAWGLVYMLGWTASLVGLQRLEAAGTTRFGRALLWAVLVCLTIANLSNVYQILLPDQKNSFFYTIDAFWPISNVLMLPLGITVWVARRLVGWRRFVPLLVGLWFPLGMGLMLLAGRAPIGMYLMGGYSAVTWFLLGYVVYSSQTSASKRLMGLMV